MTRTFMETAPKREEYDFYKSKIFTRVKKNKKKTVKTEII